jgi:hypothetical protein
MEGQALYLDVIPKALPLLADHFKPLTARVERIGLCKFFPSRFIKEYDLLL